MHKVQGAFWSHHQMYQNSLPADMPHLHVPCFEGHSLKIWILLCKEAAAVGQRSGNTQIWCLPAWVHSREDVYNLQWDLGRKREFRIAERKKGILTSKYSPQKLTAQQHCPSFLKAPRPTFPTLNLHQPWSQKAEVTVITVVSRVMSFW